MSVHLRLATIEDAAALAPLNAQLIRDSGHRNPMSVPQLQERMVQWLNGEYQAAIFNNSSGIVGYALFRREPEFIYLRQLFVVPSLRRSGIGRAALNWLWANVWLGASRLRIDVLVGNTSAHAFWRSVGFRPYFITMELERPSAS